MTANEQRSIYVRIIEISAVKMVRSGNGSLDDFNRWWSAVDASQKQ